ncbi:MAG: glycerol-3-phosphate 1-O-acyltransferase PlsY [Acutalibacteraceae bacterium]|nr:glycerol-3-phosphate 1-O-acyltransferase PlsY [Clostridia bacterium]MEE1330370.1 glycerol-3-phosphate 1-O-acyltransferase PlsY [Acutalibacteraceae bacterium]
MWLLCVAAVIAAYLLGSINFAVIFANAFLKKDVRKLGSGNAGTTNVMRTAGLLPGILTFVCDALKGFVACYIGKTVFFYVMNNSGAYAHPLYGAYLCGVICMLGHVFPAFFQFKGGKGVAVSVGIYAVCCPKAIIIGLTVFALCVLITRIVSLSSLIATVTVISLSIVFYNYTEFKLLSAILSISMGLIIFLKHKDNIKRLIKGEEKKIKIRRHSDG